jgi:hypothetical protein
MKKVFLLLSICMIAINVVAQLQQPQAAFNNY